MLLTSGAPAAAGGDFCIALECGFVAGDICSAATLHLSPAAILYSAEAWFFWVVLRFLLRWRPHQLLKEAFGKEAAAGCQGGEQQETSI